MTRLFYNFLKNIPLSLCEKYVKNCRKKIQPRTELRSIISFFTELCWLVWDANLVCGRLVIQAILGHT
jgi:hypothetical protein